MRKVLIDLNRNLAKLNDHFKELLLMFFDKQKNKLLEKLMERSSRLLKEVWQAIEQFKWEKVTELLLGFLDEADALMDDIAWRVSFKSMDKVAHAIRELLQVIRSQVIFLDQFRQSQFAF